MISSSHHVVRLSLGVFCLAISTARASVIDVPADHATIQAAIDAAVDTDEIIVAPGTYVGAIDFLGKAITVRSSGGAAVTTIDGNGSFHVVQCVNSETAATVLEGFTITGGNANGASSEELGGGMYNVGSSPTVTNCVFNLNAAVSGAGMCNRFGSSPMVTGCTFSSNTASFGAGGMYNLWNSSPIVTDCLFIDNSADFGGGMYNIVDSHPIVTSCTFTGNSTILGAGMNNAIDSIPTVTSCLFSGNIASASGGGMANADRSHAKITNCVFSANEADFGGGIYNAASSPSITNCTFSFNVALSNITGAGIYNTGASSPAVANCILWSNFGGAISNGDPTISNPTVSFSDVSGGLTAGSIDGGGNIDVNPAFVASLGLDGILGTADDNLRVPFYSLVVDQGDKNAAGLIGIDTDFDGNARVSGGAVDMGAFEVPCMSLGVENVTQSTFHCSIQNCIDQAIDGDECVADPGEYVEGIDFLGKAITVRSKDGPDITTIHGNGVLHVVQCVSGETSTTVLQGFTIRGGSADGVAFPDTVGAGMYNDGSSPTVTSCRFIDNSATIGGGMFNNFSSPTVVDCIFTGNTSTADGGAMGNDNNSNPTVTNCTITGNIASGVAGGILNTGNSSPTMTNMILWGNSPNEISNFDTGADNPTVSFSDVQGGLPAGTIDGGGNIDVDPQFADIDGADNVVGTDDDNLHLLLASPCTDAGDNTALGLFGIISDYDGNSRFSGAAVDMGAYEAQGLGVPIPTISQWGMVAMTLCMMTAGTVVFMRRKTQILELR